MDDFGQTVKWEPDATVRTATYMQLNEGHSSNNVEVATDFDYLELLDGAGEVEIDGRMLSLDSERMTVVPRGALYRLHASVSADLSVTIYSVDGKPKL